MILSDRQIRKYAIMQKMIDPFEPEQIRTIDGIPVLSFGPSSYGYDIRASNEWRLINPGLTPDQLSTYVLSPKHPLTLEQILIPVIAPSIRIQPGHFALARSFEYIRMPRNATGIVIGKSSYARCGGQIYITPLEAGWEGEITIEIHNATPCQIEVYAGEGIGQILFLEGDTCDVSYADRPSKYQCQRGVTLGTV